MVALFIITLVVSFTAVRIGAVAFQLTGLEWSLAKFQSLSCFTGTGFTTREAELITGNPRRRQIASVLMVLGNAGFVVLVATFVSSLNPESIFKEGLEKSILPFHIPSWLVPWVNILIMAVSVYVIYKIFTNTKIATRLTNSLRKRISKREMFRPVSFEDLITITGGYGVSRVDVCEGSHVLNKTLAQSELRKHDITVLAIVRGESSIPNPSADTKILLQDQLLCFGKLERIRKDICFNNVSKSDAEVNETAAKGIEKSEK